MIINYPSDYKFEIDHLLKDESPAFWHELESKNANSGLRVNTSKLKSTLLQQNLSIVLHPLPWVQDGFRIEQAKNLGKHPFHGAGLFYLQEPSAMAPVSVLDPQPGELILDLCAAPGGKTTQILSLMKNQGILVANDSNPKRAQALIRNSARWGARNAIITCESPKRLAGHFGAIFDRVLVDAPCSGEGTFRSAPGEIKKWSKEFSKRCASIQDEILWFAGKMVKPGGVLVYSTCTFNQLENEGSISRFLDNDRGFLIDTIPDAQGFSPGIKISEKDRRGLKRSVRIWPHIAPGEGHFISRLKKINSSDLISIPRNRLPAVRENHRDIYTQFFNQTLKSTPGTSDINPDSKSLDFIGNQFYMIPPESPAVDGLRVLRWGWMIGTVKTDRFNPSPDLASGISRNDAQKVIEFPLDDRDLNSYMRGSPISTSSDNYLEKGWVLITTEGYPLGWGKYSQGRIKSHFPNWLR